MGNDEDPTPIPILLFKPRDDKTRSAKADKDSSSDGDSDDDDPMHLRLLSHMLPMFAVRQCLEELKLQGYEINDDSEDFPFVFALYMYKIMENELQKLNDYYDMEEKDEEKNVFLKIFDLETFTYKIFEVGIKTSWQELGEWGKSYFTSKDLPIPNIEVQTNLSIDGQINQLRSFLRDKNRQVKNLKHELFLQKQSAEDELFDKPSSSKSKSSTEIDLLSSTEINKKLEHLDFIREKREKDEIKTFKNENAQLQNSLQVKERNISEMNRQMNSKNQEIDTLKNERTQLQNSLQVKERNITEMNGQMNSKDQEIGSLREQLREAEDGISARMNTEAQATNNTEKSWVIRRSEITDYGEVLGKGGWGEVREARFRGTKVAVKKMHDLILSSYNRKQFEREITIAMRVRHPNFVQFMRATDDDKEMLFVMEMLQKDLRSLLENKASEGSSLPDQQILQIAFDVIRALVYLHQSHPQIIHRDISSANVLLYETKQGWRAKLSDYGSANLVARSRTQNPGAAIYSAPEAGGKNQNHSLDVYSFGVLFCEMLTKEMPDPANRQAQVNKITNEAHGLLVTQCIKPKAKQRPNSMDVLKQIEKWMTDKSNSNDNNPVQLRRSLDSERRYSVVDMANNLQRY